jgi:hypothetical protein
LSVVNLAGTSSNWLPISRWFFSILAQNQKLAFSQSLIRKRKNTKLFIGKKPFPKKHKKKVCSIIQ